MSWTCGVTRFFWGLDKPTRRPPPRFPQCPDCACRRLRAEREAVTEDWLTYWRRCEAKSYQMARGQQGPLSCPQPNSLINDHSTNIQLAGNYSLCPEVQNTAPFFWLVLGHSQAAPPPSPVSGSPCLPTRHSRALRPPRVGLMPGAALPQFCAGIVGCRPTSVYLQQMPQLCNSRCSRWDKSRNRRMCSSLQTFLCLPS